MRKHTMITEDFDGHDYELEFEPTGNILKAQVGDKVVIAYLVQDDDYRDIDDMMGDCTGKLLSFHRWSKDIEEGAQALGNTLEGEPDLDAVWYAHRREAQRRAYHELTKKFTFDELLATYTDQGREPKEGETDEEFVDKCMWDDLDEYDDWHHLGCDDEAAVEAALLEMWSEPEYFPGDPDAQLLDCYDHSGQHWSLSGSGMQCRWDTASGAGVWQPDKYLRQQIDSDVAEGKDRQAQCRIYAQQFLGQFNSILAGDVYGCVVETFELEGDQIESDSCWGFVGGDYAEESLKDCFFDPTCAALAKQYEEDVRTQCGKQVEIV